ncbi:MAG TPA: hypothetical protein DHV62_02930 [Elusimicrobia bacterium]|nr:hypothetical protein [Elusimicrobiota bacterium]
MVLTAFIYFRHVLKKVSFVIIPNIRWKEMIFFSVPLVPYSLLIWANNFVDRYFILHILNLKQVSIYAVAYSLAAVIGLFYSIVGYTLYPYLASLWNNQDKSGASEMLRKANEYYLFFAFPFIAILTILSTPIIRILSTAEYFSGWQVVFWLSLGIAIFGLYQLNIYPLLLVNKTILTLKISVIALLVNIIFNAILIPIIGILGSAITTFLSNCVLALWTIVVSKKYLPYMFPWQTTIKMVLATLIMSIFLLVIVNYVYLKDFPILIFIVGLAIIIYGSVNFLNKNPVLLHLKRNL